ncbi:MAG: choline kinase family protein [Rhizobiaceae bacterium]|nr:choline kinase family protein [Rhizobiaceae bacterium]
MCEPFGQPSPDDEEALRCVLAGIPSWRGRAIVARRLDGGISNVNWRLSVEGEAIDYVVKIPGRGACLLVDRGCALAATRQAAGLGIGPRTFDHLAHADMEITEFVAGHRPSTHRDFDDPAIRGNVVEAYRRLHGSPALPATKTVFAAIDDHVGQLARLGARLSPDMRGMLAQCRAAHRILEDACPALVPCFNDPMPGNFLIGPGRSLVLVDFEYASNNDPLYDLAVLSGEMFFPAATERQILRQYFGRYCEADHARLTVYKTIADVKWSLWAAVQARVSNLRFDFHKYGSWKKLRARDALRGENWRAATSLLEIESY